MESKSPLTPNVTIGMPVFNEERFVALSIESLLNQTYSDFRLVISDNASTDRTMEICRGFAERDPRILLIEHPKNLGAVANFQFVLKNVETPYFMWAGSHDLWADDFLENLVSTLDRQTDAGLAYAKTRVIDGQGETTTACTPDRDSFIANSPLKRASEIVSSLTWCNMVYGLFRTEVISKCRLSVPCLGNDHVFLMETALRSKILHVPTTTFIRREYRDPPPDARAQQLAQLGRILGMADVERQLDRRYTNWLFEHLKSAFRVPARWHVRTGTAISIGATFIDRWEPQFESRLILLPYQVVRAGFRRVRKTRSKFARVRKKIATRIAKST